MSDLINPFELVANAIGCNSDSLSKESAMYRDFGWDSLGHVNVILALEKEYGIVIDDESVESYKTMSEILKCYEIARRNQKSNV